MEDTYIGQEVAAEVNLSLNASNSHCNSALDKQCGVLRAFEN